MADENMPHTEKLARRILGLGWSRMVEPLPQIVGEAIRLIEEDRGEATTALRAEVRALTQRLEEARQARRSAEAVCENLASRAGELHREKTNAEADLAAALARAEGLEQGMTSILTWSQERGRSEDLCDILRSIEKRARRALAGPSAAGGRESASDALLLLPSLPPDPETDPAPPTAREESQTNLNPLADALAELMASAQQAQPLVQEMSFTHVEGDSFRVTVQCIGRHAVAPPSGAPTKGDEP